MELISNGIGWLVGKGVAGIAYGAGTFCRFMSTECQGTFIIFALVGGLVYIGGGERLGMKMIRLSLGSYLVMSFVGVLM